MTEGEGENPEHLTTLFLHRDWACQSDTPSDSPQHLDLLENCETSIEITTTRPKNLLFLCHALVPGTLITYSILYVVLVVFRLSGLRLSRSKVNVSGGIDLPCFFSVPLSRFVDLGLDGSSTAVAVAGLVCCVVISVRCSIGRAYFSFVAFWSRSNAEFVVWCALSGALMLVMRGAEGISAAVVVFLSPALLPGIDFAILLTGRRSSAWSLRMYRTFFILNALAIAMSYIGNIIRRNLCVTPSVPGNLAVAGVFFNIAEAGQLLAVIKIHAKKITNVYHPALRYGTLSHVLGTLPQPGDKAVLDMGDGEVILMPVETVSATPGQKQKQRVVHFIFPSSAFLRMVNLWSMTGVLWLAIANCISGLNAAVLRAVPTQKCWVTRPAFAALPSLSVFNAVLAAALLVAMFSLVFKHGLGRVFAGWMRYWYRRNRVLVAASFLRGLTIFRPEYPASDWISSFVNSSIFLCVALSAFDLIVLLTQSRTQMFLYRLYVITQIFTAFVAYVTGLSLDNPCDRSKLSRSMAWFIINKIQASVLLFHSLFYLHILIRTKLFEGVAVPIISFATARFWEENHRQGPIPALKPAPNQIEAR